MSEHLQQYRFLKNILPDPSSPKLVLLTGARQTGKTTLALDKYPQLRHINLDAPEDREALRAISSASWGRDIGNAVLDEAQKEPIVFDKVKYAYDRKDITFSILLGSSQVLLLKKIRESLAGRISLYELWPLMMSEIYWEAGSKSVELPLVDKLSGSDTLNNIMKNVPSVLTETEDAPRRRAEDYLVQWGGMPALLPLSNEERWKWMKDYEYTYLERDLADLARLSDLSPFRKFQKLAALRSAKLLNYSELARDAGVSVDTAKRYLEYLRISYQTVLLQPYHKNITSSVVKTPKVYWTDIGLLRHLTGFKGELTGEIYETMVVGELYKWVKTSQKDTELSFYRSRSGLEVDILVETEIGIIGMEIKARKTIAPKDTTSMKDVASALGEKWRGGIVIYTGNEIRKIAEPEIWAVPSRRLFI
ncbi:MAG: hypothetical protein A2W27_08390 [Deltaproteobacteria bacterium RBG_16_44_11]|nr:MAG: hypothetical protein A2W27_08390 [Deltaproteobacteria bacterium RBG_16_44_11]